MIDAYAAWNSLLFVFLPVFTSPFSLIFLRVACAWVLCPGRRTITRLYAIAEPTEEKAHDAYHRFFRDGVWLMSSLWKALSLLPVGVFYRNGRVGIDLDDTLFHKSGRKVEGASWWRDAVRSTGKKLVYDYGLNIVLLTLRVEPPWGGEPLGLPVNMRIHLKGGPGLLDLAKEMVEEFVSWIPERQFELCADGFYASIAAQWPKGVYFTSRMRCDAAIYELPPPKRKGQRGRPPQKGKRLPTPLQMANEKRGWRKVETIERGKKKERLVKVRDVLWHRVAPGRLVRLVISRDPDGVERDDFFFTTDLKASPEKIIGRYAGRWSIEDSFKNVKQYLGGQYPQSWKNKGPLRTAAFSFWLYSIIWLWYIQTNGTKISWKPTPWYTKKQTPSFLDALAQLRRVLWRKRIFSNSEKAPEETEITETIIDILAQAA